MSKERLDEIWRRTEAASEGPWTVSNRRWTDGGVRLQYREIVGPDGRGVLEGRSNFPDRTKEGDRQKADVLFAAHARDDVPWLLKKIAAMSSTIAGLEYGEGALERAAAALHEKDDRIKDLEDEIEELRRKIS